MHPTLLRFAYAVSITASQASALTWSEPALVVEAGWADERLEATFVARNDQDSPARPIGAWGDCDCLFLDWPKAAVPPGGVTQLRVSLPVQDRAGEVRFRLGVKWSDATGEDSAELELIAVLPRGVLTPVSELRWSASEPRRWKRLPVDIEPWLAARSRLVAARCTSDEFEVRLRRAWWSRRLWLEARPRAPTDTGGASETSDLRAVVTWELDPPAPRTIDAVLLEALGRP